MLFAEVTDVGGCATGCVPFADSWNVVDGVTQVPDWADESFDDELTVGEVPSKFLSKFYYEASFGEYTLLGDYYDKVLQVPCTYFSGCSTANEGQDLYGVCTTFKPFDGLKNKEERNKLLSV